MRISAFFHHLEAIAGADALAKSAEELLEIFIAKYPHRVPYDWFDLEFRNELGIDVYAEPFDHDQRYVKLTKARALIFRVDCDDTTKSREITEALGFNVEVRRDHDGSAKQYAEKYSEFKRIARLPDDFLDTAYGSKYAKHFWSEQELSRYRSAWSKHS